MQGILSSVEMDGITLLHWKMYPLSFDALGVLSKFQPIQQITNGRNNKVLIHGDAKNKLRASSFYRNGKPMTHL
jgi:beta-galactosidase